LTEALLKYAALIALVYALIPTVLARYYGVGVISRLPSQRIISITFDDGPDPRYTPRVLDILRQAETKACFFVVGEKAQKYPEIIKTIVSEGHEIGSHGYKHRNPWFLGPLGTFREIRKSFEAIEEIAGSPPAVYRPPWGLINLPLLITHLNLGYKIVLWSFMSWDWTNKTTAEAISDKVRKKIAGGSILIFHDSDTVPGAASGSPEKMLQALPGILKEIKERGYSITPLKDLLNSGRSLSDIFLAIWKIWDYILRLLLQIEDVTDSSGKKTIFRISVGHYPGPCIELPCGGILRPGEKICDLHLNNDYLRKCIEKENRPEKIGIKIARELRSALAVLAGCLQRNPRFDGVNFITAITLLHRGTALAGFTPVEISSPKVKRIISAYQGLILNLYHPMGKQRLHGKGSMEPKIIVMSREKLSQYTVKAPKENNKDRPST